MVLAASHKKNNIENMETVEIKESIYNKVSQMGMTIVDSKTRKVIKDEDLFMMTMAELCVGFTDLTCYHNLMTSKGVEKFMYELELVGETDNFRDTTIRDALEHLLDKATQNNWNIVVRFPQTVIGISRLIFNMDFFGDGISTITILTKRGDKGMKDMKPLRTCTSDDRHIRIVYDYV